MVLTQHHWANDLLNAGHRPGRRCSKMNHNNHVFVIKVSHLTGGYRLRSGMERDGLHHVSVALVTPQEMKTNTQPIPDRSLLGLTRAALSAVYQGRSGKYTTDVTNNKLRARDNIIIGTWNVRTLSVIGKLEKLTHEMNRYRWNILGLCEMRWKNFGETSTLDGHKLYFSGREDKHKEAVGFLVHNHTTNCVMGCQPKSSQLITIRLRAKPFNITIIQACCENIKNLI